MTAKTQSLKKSVVQGASWTLVGVGAGQILRLGKSLILSRLLFPEAYGVMAIVWAVLYALDMLSDVGIAPGIIRSQRGDDPDFLNTAWTMKTIRGAVLAIVACAIAYPISIFYNQPVLAWLIPVAGLTTLIEGFCSTNIYSCQRNMVFKPVMLLDISIELVGLLVTLTWAYFYPSAWALLGGAVISRLFHVVASHILLPGIRNKFLWDPKAFNELLHFGKWIMFSSLVYLLYMQGDRMLLGKYLDTTLLGVYGIAIMLSESVNGVVVKLNDSVIYPALSRVVNSDEHRLQQVFYRARLGTDALMIVPIAVLMMIANEVVSTLYDSRYHAAGWMLQILCIRLLMMSILVSSASCLMALGHSRYAMIQNLCRVTWLFIGIPIAWPMFGMHGVVWVISLTELPVLVLLWSGMRKYQILSITHELRSFLFVAAGILLGYGLLQLPIGSR